MWCLLLPALLPLPVATVLRPPAVVLLLPTVAMLLVVVLLLHVLVPMGWWVAGCSSSRFLSDARMGLPFFALVASLYCGSVFFVC